MSKEGCDELWHNCGKGDLSVKWTEMEKDVAGSEKNE